VSERDMMRGKMRVRPLALGLVVGHCVTLLAVSSGFLWSSGDECRSLSAD